MNEQSNRKSDEEFEQHAKQRFDESVERLDGATRLGYLPENGPLYADMTPRTLLAFFAEARGMSSSRASERIHDVIDLCSLHSVIGKPISKLNTGDYIITKSKGRLFEVKRPNDQKADVFFCKQQK